jgi:hypothetical protein
MNARPKSAASASGNIAGPAPVVINCVSVEGGVGPEPEPGVGVAATAILMFLMLAEQMTSAPPPFADPLH